MMLHVTNGDAAVDALREAGMTGEFLPWRDVLHEGPTPRNVAPEEFRSIRARFIADRGWESYDVALAGFSHRDAVLASFGDHEETILWFEHDLYDQLQLVQILDRLAGEDRSGAVVTLITSDDYLSLSSPERLRELYERRRPVTEQDLAAGRETWEAFCDADPARLISLVARQMPSLPFLTRALRRHMQEFPWISHGLSRSEAQALESVIDGASPREAFIAAHHEREDAVFLGDSVFAWYLERLGAGDEPLIRTEDGSPLRAPRADEEGKGFWNGRIVATETGRRVLRGEIDRSATAQADRWLGGVAPCGEGDRWRWDEEAGTLRLL